MLTALRVFFVIKPHVELSSGRNGAHPEGQQPKTHLRHQHREGDPRQEVQLRVEGPCRQQRGT